MGEHHLTSEGSGTEGSCSSGTLRRRRSVRLHVLPNFILGLESTMLFHDDRRRLKSRSRSDGIGIVLSDRILFTSERFNPTFLSRLVQLVDPNSCSSSIVRLQRKQTDPTGRTRDAATGRSSAFERRARRRRVEVLLVVGRRGVTTGGSFLGRGRRKVEGMGEGRFTCQWSVRTEGTLADVLLGCDDARG